MRAFAEEERKVARVSAYDDDITAPKYPTL